MTINLQDLDKTANKILKLLKVKNSYADVFLVSNSEIRELNRKFRKKDKPTNVLAFPDPASFPAVQKHRRLGEIYLSSQYIEAHNEDLIFMLVHGVLHLLGFNHIKKNDRIEMEMREKKLMQALQQKNHVKKRNPSTRHRIKHN